MSPEFAQTPWISAELAWPIIIAGTALLAIVWIARRVRRFIRRRRAPVIHPKLQKYQQGEEFAAQRRREAAKIIATSSAHEVTGYRVVRQIEAVFVDGFRRPEEAVEGLKAVAAMKGANGITNVRHAPAGMGKYSASGDAVVLETPPTSGGAAAHAEGSG